MQRKRSVPRQDWERIVESQGFLFHTLDDEPYWDESAYYEFAASEVDELERASYALNDMCLAAVQHVIDERRFAEFQIPAAFEDFVAQSWERDEFTLYGRFDMAFDGGGPPKLLEYNADTPTALLEAAVIQWHWFRELFPQLDQFNSIHERLIEAWKSHRGACGGFVHFSSVAGSVEDLMTVTYLRDTATQAGVKTEHLAIDQIGWNAGRGAFVDLGERPIGTLFKLYPWEWLVREAFGPHVAGASTRWLEPPWKMLLSNKAILPVLYELYPDSPYLLEASFEPLDGNYVRKPIFSREGANIVMVEDGMEAEYTDGDYSGPYIYQRLHPLRRFHDQHVVVGSWMVNGYACGIGLREDASRITQNTSRFVPHVFIP